MSLSTSQAPKPQTINQSSVFGLAASFSKPQRLHAEIRRSRRVTRRRTTSMPSPAREGRSRSGGEISESREVSRYRCDWEGCRWTGGGTCFCCWFLFSLYMIMFCLLIGLFVCLWLRILFYTCLYFLSICWFLEGIDSALICLSISC